MANILIFDSGVGGLSIAAAIRASMPEHCLVFASDNAAYPYGVKTEEELIPRVIRVVEHLLKEVRVDVLVVACNTASTVVLPALRELLDIDVVGVVPAIKPAAKISQTKHLGLLATPATVQRQYTKNLIASFADDCHVDLIGSSVLVDLAEQKLHQGKSVSSQDLERIVKPWLAANCHIDTIVLACTHFPLLQHELAAVFSAHKKEIQWVDSAQGIAKRVGFLLEKQSSQSPSISQLQNNSIDDSAIFTGVVSLSEEFKRYLATLQIQQVRFCPL